MTTPFDAKTESTNGELVINRNVFKVENLVNIFSRKQLVWDHAGSSLTKIQIDAGGVSQIGTTSKMLAMQTEIDELRDRVTTLEEQIETLEEASIEDVIVLRTITREDAETEILALFTAGETLYYSDIAERLRIDLPMVVEICQELRERGEIGIDDDAS